MNKSSHVLIHCQTNDRGNPQKSGCWRRVFSYFKKEKKELDTKMCMYFVPLNCILKMVEMGNFMFVYILAQFNIHSYINT